MPGYVAKASDHGSVRELSELDAMCLRHAQEFIRVENVELALMALDAIEDQNHRDALIVRCAVLKRQRNWKALEQAAVCLMQEAQDTAEGALFFSEAMHGTQDTEQALDFLTSYALRFAMDAHVAYHLARFSCALGEHDTAASYLRRAFSTGAGASLKEEAANEPDFRPIAAQIPTL
ncbi:MAG: hypothetical protein L0Y58_10615 [Verrucomicrobia subdivision 3 bacterium]|nr:hypothetical protein [Limisphaerales bacterium]